MYHHSGAPLGFTASILLAGMFSACSDRANRDETASGTGSASVGDTAAVAADTLAGPSASPDLTDANIVALLDHANEADSSAGALASKKATNAEVKKYARMMMADHHRLRKQGADLAKKLSLTPEPPADDPVTPLARQEMDALQSAEKGLDFDRTYIQQEITAHQAVLDLADQAHDSADNAELKALIEQARPLIENHLKQAQAIEKKLGATG
jgi:putative membrane protein